MTEIVPFNFDDHELRVVMIGGEPWFVAGDVCAILDLVDVSRAVSRLDEADKSTARVSFDHDQPRNVLVVNESGLFDLILDSRKPEAKRLRRKVTREILPSIRKTGAYFEEMDLPTALEKYAASLREKAAAERRAIEAQSRVVELAPKAVEWDYYMDSTGLCGLAYLGQQLGAGRNRLINRLRELGVLVSRDESQGGVRPMQRYVEQDWFVVKTKNTPVGPKPEAYATPKGVSRVYRLLVENGVGTQNWRTLPPSEEALLRAISFED